MKASAPTVAHSLVLHGATTRCQWLMSLLAAGTCLAVTKGPGVCEPTASPRRAAPACAMQRPSLNATSARHLVAARMALHALSKEITPVFTDASSEPHSNLVLVIVDPQRPPS